MNPAATKASQAADLQASSPGMIVDQRAPVAAFPAEPASRACATSLAGRRRKAARPRANRAPTNTRRVWFGGPGHHGQVSFGMNAQSAGRNGGVVAAASAITAATDATPRA